MKTKMKNQLFSLIIGTAKSMNYSQRDLGKVLNLSQPRVSNLLNERHDVFSLDMLLHYIDMLGYNVDLMITERSTVEG